MRGGEMCRRRDARDHPWQVDSRILSKLDLINGRMPNRGVDASPTYKTYLIGYKAVQ